MQLSNATVNVLKNFSQINPSIVLKPGTTLSTMSPQKSIMANAIVEDQFPTGGAIYDLGRFLGVVSLFDKPTFTFNEKQVDIRDNQKSVSYTYCSEEMVLKPTKESIDVAGDVNINITHDTIQQVLRAATVMSLPDICVSGADTISLKAINADETTHDVFEQVVGTNDTDHRFKFVFKTENLKLLPGDYNLKIDSRGISQWTSINSSPSVTYWIAVEQNHSSFD